MAECGKNMFIINTFVQTNIIGNTMEGNTETKNMLHDVRSMGECKTR